MAAKDRLKMSKKELQDLQKLQQYVAPVDSSTFIGNYRSKNRYKEKVGDKWVWYDRATGKPWDDKAVAKAFASQRYGTETPGADLKYLKAKQLLINKTKMEVPGGQGSPSYNIRRAFSAPTKDPNVKVFDEEMAAKREALGRELLTAQGKSSYATPEQQQFLKNDDRVPQSTINTAEFLDGLGMDLTFTNKNKLNINPYFGQEHIDKFKDAGYQAPETKEVKLSGTSPLAINQDQTIEENVDKDVNKSDVIQVPKSDSLKINKKDEERVKAIERVYGAQLMHKKTKEARNAFIKKKLNQAPSVMEVENY